MSYKIESPTNFRRHTWLPAVMASVLLLGLLAACSDDPTDPSACPCGTIVVDVSPDTVSAIWVCTHLEGDVITGQGDSTLTRLQPGTYTMTWGDAFGLVTPAQDTVSLDKGATINFTGVYGSHYPQPETGGWLFDVLGTAADDVCAVGPGGTLLHFDGDNWSRVNLGTDLTINALARDIGGNMWSCGDFGGIWYRTGGQWRAMASGTTRKLYALGLYRNLLHAGGEDGYLARFIDSHWTEPGRDIIERDPVSQIPIDTLDRAVDLAAITTISLYAVGGAMVLPDYVGTPVGVEGTQGMALGIDPEYSWRLDRLGLGALDSPNWVLCSTVGSSNLDHNYLGLLNGDLLQSQAHGVDVRWERLPVMLGNNPGSGARDLWLAADGDLYAVTGDGLVVHLPPAGTPEILYDASTMLTGIWGSGPDNLWVTGLWENQILHLDHDPMSGSVQASMWDTPELPSVR